MDAFCGWTVGSAQWSDPSCVRCSFEVGPAAGSEFLGGGFEPEEVVG